MSKGIKAFITYAHSDSRQKFELQMRLSVMKQNGEIADWDDNQILAGDEWEKEISTRLADSDILLYLVSAKSLASKNCNKELVEALKNTNTTTIPIILENCDWKAHEISNFQVLPDKGKAINKWSPRSDGWQNVVEGIRKTVQAIQKVEAEPPANRQEKEKIDALTLFQQANFLLMLGQFDQAIQLYSEIIDVNHNLPEAYNNRGNAYCKRSGEGDHDRAIADYDKAIKLDPDYALAYNNRGNAYVLQGDYKRAIANFDKTTKLNPDDAVAYCNLGVAYYRRNNSGDYEQAFANLDKATKLDSGYAQAYNNRGLVHQARGDYDLAIADYDIAIALDRGHALAYYNRGEARLHLKLWEEAKRDLKTARDKGIDIIDLFNIVYKNVADFESKTGIKLPADIAEMLTRKPDKGKS